MAARQVAHQQGHTSSIPHGYRGRVSGSLLHDHQSFAMLSAGGMVSQLYLYLRWCTSLCSIVGPSAATACSTPAHMGNCSRSICLCPRSICLLSACNCDACELSWSLQTLELGHSEACCGVLPCGSLCLCKILMLRLRCRMRRSCSYTFLRGTARS